MQYELKAIPKNNDEHIGIKINTSQDAADYARQFYHDDIIIYESFFIILLDRENKILGWAKIAQGGIIAVYVDVKIIAKYVVDVLASGLILVHNHPSGQLKPSEPDKALTKKISNALAFLDSKVLDHIILTKESHYSFGDNLLL